MIGIKDLQELDANTFINELRLAIENSIFTQPLFHLDEGDGSIDSKQSLIIPLRTPQKLILVVDMEVQISEAFSNHTAEDGYHKCYEVEYKNLRSFQYLSRTASLRFLKAEQIKDHKRINKALKSVFDKLWVCHYPSSSKSVDYYLHNERIAIC